MYHTPHVIFPLILTLSIASLPNQPSFSSPRCSLRPTCRQLPSITRGLTFKSALVSPTNITFEGLASPGGQVYYGSSGPTISGVTINATNNNLYALSSTDSFTVTMNASLGTCGGSGNTTFTLPAGIIVFGIDFRSHNQQTGPNGITGTLRFVFVTTGGPLIVDKDGSADNPNHQNFAQFLHFDNVTISHEALQNTETPEPSPPPSPSSASALASSIALHYT